MAQGSERIDLIRRRLPGARRREFAIAWPRALTRAVICATATLILVMLVAIGRPETSVDLGFRGFLGLVAVIGTLVVLFAYYLERFQADKIKPIDSPARTWLFGAVLLLLLVVMKGLLLLDMDPHWLILLAPIPAAGITLAVVYDQRFAFDNLLFAFAMIGVLIGTHSGKDEHMLLLANALAVEGDQPALAPEFLATLQSSMREVFEKAQVIAILFLGTAVGIIQTRHLRSRTKLLKVGLFCGLAMATAVMGFQMLDVASVHADRSALEQLQWIALAVAHGAITGMVVSSMVPLVEQALGMVTEMRLLELEDGNHPLIRMMIERAPGTYMHTQNVARIASAAVEAIGGNALLTRVGTLFHDIGKMVRPEYFTENEPNSKLYHDRLSPQMSSMIILSHIKEGIVLARHYKLPRILEDFITGHHGTSAISYFYRMAKMNAKPGERIDEGMFRYPGPKPQTREAAIVAIADLVEAAGRAKLDGKQTPATIRKFVHECVMMKLNDGQFDECDLTLKDLRIAEDTMVKTLASMYHHRVKYPDDPDAKLQRLAVMEKEEYKREMARRRDRIMTQ